MENIKFDPEKVRQYKLRRSDHNREYSSSTQSYNYNYSTDAIMALFDQNADTNISKKEFKQISKEQYNSYIADLNSYNQKFSRNDKLPDYETLTFLLEKGSATGEEVSLFIHNPFKFDMNNLPKTKKLKDTSQMTRDEIIQELLLYKEEYSKDELENTPIGSLKSRVRQARKEISFYDKMSDKVDWHIGTFHQGDNGLCSFLSIINSFSHKDLKQLYRKETDENGNKYYKIQFPIDIADGKFVIITEEELKNGEITYQNPESDEIKTLGIFSKGDPDVTLLEMAFLKRFGDNFLKNGANYSEYERIFNRTGENEYKKINSFTTAEFESLKYGSILSAIGDSTFNELQIDKKFKLSDGRTGEVLASSIRLSDGTSIKRQHAMMVKKYDPKTKELIVLGNEFNNFSEIRIPLEMAKYFKGATKN